MMYEEKLAAIVETVAWLSAGIASNYSITSHEMEKRIDALVKLAVDEILGLEDE
jgi:hypothetical protein